MSSPQCPVFGISVDEYSPPRALTARLCHIRRSLFCIRQVWRIGNAAFLSSFARDLIPQKFSSYPNYQSAFSPYIYFFTFFLHISNIFCTFVTKFDLFLLSHKKVSEKFRNIRYLITIIYAP